MKKIIIVLLAFTAIISAQESRRLNLQNSIEIALKNNNTLKQIRYDKAIADQKVIEAWGTSVFPSIDGKVNFNRNLKLGVTVFEVGGVQQKLIFGTKNNLTGAISFEQPLFTGAMFLAIKIANTFSELASKNVKYNESELISKVKESFYNLLLGKEMIKLAELNLSLSKENMQNVMSMYDAGLIAEYDLLKAEVQYQNTIPALMEIKNQYLNAKNVFKIILGLELNDKIEVQDSLHYLPKEEIANKDVLQEMLNNNISLKQLKLDIELRDYATSYEFSQHLPQLKLVGNWQLQALENDNRSLFHWEYNESAFIGLSLSLPIFKGFSTISKTEQAEIEYKKSLEEYKKAQLNLSMEVENTMRTLNKTSAQIKSYKLSVKQTSEGYNSALKRFNAGLGTQLEVSGALVDFSSARVNLLTSIRDYNVLNAKLDHLLGKYIN